MEDGKWKLDAMKLNRSGGRLFDERGNDSAA